MIVDSELVPMEAQVADVAGGTLGRGNYPIFRSIDSPTRPYPSSMGGHDGTLRNEVVYGVRMSFFFDLTT